MNQPVSTSGEKNDDKYYRKLKQEQAQIKVDDKQAINLYLVKQSISKRKLSKKDKILATGDKEIKHLNTLKISSRHAY